MRAPSLAVVLTLSMPVDPALGCHLFHVWRFPWPQHCPMSHFATLRPAPARTAPEASAPVVDVHAQAIEALKRWPEEPAWLPVLEEK